MRPILAARLRPMLSGPISRRISDTSLTFTPLFSATPLTINMGSKAIQELFELDYGRMNATLGVELPFTNAGNQTTIPLGYIDPPTEILDASATIAPPVAGDGTQIWKITHNGVDTHAIHFHLFNVQVINRVGWDGAIRPPDANELGWKETVRMNPLEDIIVALRPTAPKLPFGVPTSMRLLASDAGTGHPDQHLRPTNRQPVDRQQCPDQLRLGVRVALPPAGPRRKRHDAAHGIQRTLRFSRMRPLV